MATIYRDVAFAPDEQIGHIDGEGKVYGRLEEGDEYLGYINYEEREVFDSEDVLMGWVTEEGDVIASYEEEDINIGYVEEDGSLYVYGDDEENDLYLGKVAEMKDTVEGAAVLLLFYEDDDDEDFDEEEG